MTYVFISIYLGVCAVLYLVAIATTAPDVLVKPLAALAALLWPVAIPFTIVVAVFSKASREPLNEIDAVADAYYGTKG